MKRTVQPVDATGMCRLKGASLAITTTSLAETNRQTQIGPLPLRFAKTLHMNPRLSMACTSGASFAVQILPDSLHTSQSKWIVSNRLSPSRISPVLSWQFQHLSRLPEALLLRLRIHNRLCARESSSTHVRRHLATYTLLNFNFDVHGHVLNNPPVQKLSILSHECYITFDRTGRIAKSWLADIGLYCQNASMVVIRFHYELRGPGFHIEDMLDVGGRLDDADGRSQ